MKNQHYGHQRYLTYKYQWHVGEVIMNYCP